jgi:hypothetical protein
MLDYLLTLISSEIEDLDLKREDLDKDEIDNSEIIRKINSAAEVLLKITFESEITDISSIDNCRILLQYGGKQTS